MSTATILIVDDERLLRLTLLSRLEDQGFIVVEGETGEEAVRIVGEEDPDLVLLDITMPGMDGNEALQAILEHDPAARVVMITARGVTLTIGVPITGSGAGLPLPLPTAGRRIMRVSSAILSECTVRQSSLSTPPVSPELGFQDQ